MSTSETSLKNLVESLPYLRDGVALQEFLEAHIDLDDHSRCVKVFYLEKFMEILSKAKKSSFEERTEYLIYCLIQKNGHPFSILYDAPRKKRTPYCVTGKNNYGPIESLEELVYFVSFNYRKEKVDVKVDFPLTHAFLASFKIRNLMVKEANSTVRKLCPSELKLQKLAQSYTKATGELIQIGKGITVAENLEKLTYYCNEWLRKYSEHQKIFNLSRTTTSSFVELGSLGNFELTPRLTTYEELNQRYKELTSEKLSDEIINACLSIPERLNNNFKFSQRTLEQLVWQALDSSPVDWSAPFSNMIIFILHKNFLDPHPMLRDQIQWLSDYSVGKACGFSDELFIPCNLRLIRLFNSKHAYIKMSRNNIIILQNSLLSTDMRTLLEQYIESEKCTSSGLFNVPLTSTQWSDLFKEVNLYNESFFKRSQVPFIKKMYALKALGGATFADVYYALIARDQLPELPGQKIKNSVRYVMHGTNSCGPVSSCERVIEAIRQLRIQLEVLTNCKITESNFEPPTMTR